MPIALDREQVAVGSPGSPEMTEVETGSMPSLRRRRLPVVTWKSLSVAARLRTLRHARHLLAANAALLADLVPDALPRTRADTLVAEVLPLLAAIKFLEQEAKQILAPRALGTSGRPLWLSGVSTTVERVPLGTVLILAPYNYPLLLAGVQTVQALAAGNSVVWKPGRGGKPVAELFAQLLTEAGLPPDTLRVTDDSVAAAETELAAQPDKILFTGGAVASRAVLHAAAEALTPVTAELSGCDAVLVLPTADPKLVAEAILFGMRLNGSQTCMAPRRLILVDEPPPSTLRYRGFDAEGSFESEAEELALLSLPSNRPLHPTHAVLLELLKQSFAHLAPIPSPPPPHLAALLHDAQAAGATLHGDLPSGRPILVTDATPQMAIVHADIFYPVLSVLRAASPRQAALVHNHTRLSLTAAVFGRYLPAHELASQLTTGTVLINDLIVPTADPRIPFGGRRDSGFGVTRGREGLLELTALKTTANRHHGGYRHFQPTTPAHEPLFTGLIELTHAGTWRQRLAGLRKLIAAARTVPR